MMGPILPVSDGFAFERIDITRIASCYSQVSRDSLNCYSAGLGSSLYSLGSAPTENTFSSD
jgi:hypothetical protein